MNLKYFIKSITLFIPLILLSCSDDISKTIENKCKIICFVDEFESVNSSRTNTDPNNNFLITWASGDVIGIFPREGYQEPFEIPTEQIGEKSASFDGGYWDVKDGLQYNAYYPFDKRNFDSAEMKTCIPITYIGQKQNGTSCDIGAFDYTHSDWKTAANGSVSFDFHHIGAIGVFSLKYPVTTTYTKMTLSIDEALIPLNGSYDLTEEEVAMKADENSYSTSISLELTNCSGIAGETGVFYMMLPPMDLSNNKVTLSLTSEAGTTCTYSIEKALNINKGKLYRRTGIPLESEIEGTIDNWSETDNKNTSSIIFKELYYSGVPSYYFRDQYYELYNNSNSIVYLDGLHIANLAPSTATTSLPTWGNENGEQDEDDKFVYGERVWKFPGKGTDYPLQPGESVIMAQHAWNHQEANAESPVDLSGAEFEFYMGSTTYIDMPAINMDHVFYQGQADIGTLPQWIGSVFGGAYVIFKVPKNETWNPVTTDWAVQLGTSSTTRYAKIPIEYVWDAVELGNNESMVNAKRIPNVLDAGMSWVGNIYCGLSVTRYIETDVNSNPKTLENGSYIYMDTNNSTKDFKRGVTPILRRNGAKMPSWNHTNNP